MRTEGIKYHRHVGLSVMSEVVNADGASIVEMNTESEPDDLWVSETWVDSYNTKRAALEGATYAAFKEAGLKEELDWNRTHHDWDSYRSQWVVDFDSLDHLREKAAELGFSVGGGSEVPEELKALGEAAEEGDRIEVEYRMKGKDSHSTFSGEVGVVDGHMVRFTRDDGQGMIIKMDEQHKTALFTFGSHAPYVGEPTTVRLE